MSTRARLLKGATAFLYFGPLLAGLGGYGWIMVPSFVAIFVLWQMIVRPHHWPTSLRELGSTDLWVGILAQFAVQILLVVMCFGIGRGLGGAVGTLPMYAPALPLSVSFLSIPLCRILWNPWKGDQFEEGPEDGNTADNGGEADAYTVAHRLLQPLQDMNGRMSEAEAARHLSAMAEHVDHSALHKALMSRAAQPDASQAIVMALVVQTTDPAMMDMLEESGPALVMQVLPDDPDYLTLFAHRMAAAVGTDSDLAGNIPAEAHIRQRAERIGGAAGSALMLLVPLRQGLAA